MVETSVFFVAAVCIFVVFLLQKLSLWRKLPPGPVGFPILGYIPFMSDKPYLDFQKLSKTYGNVFSIQMGSRLLVVLNDFESAKEAFLLDEFAGRPDEFPIDFNKVTIETGAMFGLPWKDQRRFSMHMLKDLGLGRSVMEGHMQEEINQLLEYLKQKVGQPYRVRERLASSMSNNIGSLVFGKKYEYSDPVGRMMTRVVNDISRVAGQASWYLFFPWLKKTLEFAGIGDIGHIIRIQKDLRDHIEKEIVEHEATLNPKNIRDFIDGYLLEIKRRQGDAAFSKPVLQDVVNGFFLAGSETVRLSLEWLLLTAAAHQDAQRRIQLEIDDVVGRNHLPSWTDQKSMPYTEAFIMELNRWRTIIPLNIIKQTLGDVKLGKYHIPKDTCILSNLWAVHHDPEYWGSDADEFRPERFLTEDGKQVKKWERYIPFSIGKRACPGEYFARVEVFMTFTSILQTFNVKLPEGKTADFEGDLGVGLIPKLQDHIFTQRN